MVAHVAALPCALFALGLYANPALVTVILAVLLMPLVLIPIVIYLLGWWLKPLALTCIYMVL